MGTGGAPATANLTEQITRLDLTFSLSAVGSGGGGGDDDRIWACFGGTTDNQINLQNSRLVRCDPGWEGIDRCPKETEHGQLQATMTGGGLSADDADRIDEIAAKFGLSRGSSKSSTAMTRRLGANAHHQLSG